MKSLIPLSNVSEIKKCILEIVERGEIMKFTLEVGNNEKSRVELSRNWFTGAMQILVDGEQAAQQSWLSPSTHIGFTRKRRYDFVIGKVEKHQIVIEKERPLFMGGLRPQTYRVYVDDQLIHEQTGY